MEAINSPDVDGGWAIVVLICAGIARIVSFGVCNSTAILYATLLDDLQESPTLTSWAVNMPFVSYFLFTQVGNVLSRIVGLRATAAIGCLLSTVGLLATSFVPSVRWLFLTHGLITGIGFAFVYITQFDIITSYYVKHRKIAFSFQGVALSLSQFIYSPLLYFLFERFHWRGTFVILSAMNLNILLFAAASMKPRKSVEDGTVLEILKSPEHEEKEEDNDDHTSPPRSQLSQLVEDLRLCNNPRFTIYLVSNLLLSVGLSAFKTQVVKYSKGRGHGDVNAVFLPSVMAIAGLICRAMIGVFLEAFKLSIALPFILMFMTAGILISFYGIIYSYIPLSIITACIGFMISIYSMYPEFTILIIGVRRLATGISFIGIACGLGYFIGGPVTALLYEFDPSYVSSFVFAGLTTLTGALLSFPTIMKVKGKRLVLSARDP